MLEEIPDGEILVDLGAGYGRGVFLSQALGKNNCIGIEFVADRVLHSKSMLKKPEDLIHADLGEISLPLAYAYYLYFPKGKVFNKVLRDLVNYSNEHEIYLYVCESHGDVLNYLNSFPHFCVPVGEIPTSLPRHSEFIIKYQISNKITPMNTTHFADWYFSNDPTSYSVKIRYQNKVDGFLYDWYIPLRDLNLILYNGSFALQNYKSNRIVEINRDEPILDILSGVFDEKVRVL